jgi:hypothetical protein
MTAAPTRAKVVELSNHTPTQLLVFVLTALAVSWLLFVGVATPLLEMFFRSFLRAEVARDGAQLLYRLNADSDAELISTGTYSLWGLVTDAHTIPPIAAYVFRPFIALLPVVLVAGLALASIISAVLPIEFGYVRQKIEREILNMLDRIAVKQYGEHTPEEIKHLTQSIRGADMRRLHDLADAVGMSYDDLYLVQRALAWRDAVGAGKLFRVHDAVKFYMREYFTERYANAVLGLVYIGAAVLIIVIGLRGLKFLPATDPSVVLGALGLEFLLLITYAAMLMYGRGEESSADETRIGGGHAVVDADTEQVLRAFLNVNRSEGQR